MEPGVRSKTTGQIEVTLSTGVRKENSTCPTYIYRLIVEGRRNQIQAAGVVTFNEKRKGRRHGKEKGKKRTGSTSFIS